MKGGQLYKLKTIITYSPLHKPLMEIKARILGRSIKKSLPIPKNTIYIVSPYKTGTTYISSLWDNDTAKHEPVHLFSLKCLENDFETNFFKREGFLNLKLECSGFMSLFLSNLPKSNQQFKYIFILRSPSKWVLSVIKHFYGLKNIGYNYINEYYWKRLLGYDMVPILKYGNGKKVDQLVQDLYKIYFEIFANAVNNTDIFFVRMMDLDRLAHMLGDLIGIPPNNSHAWRREAKHKPDFEIPIYESNDEKFEYLVTNIPKNRFLPI